MRNGFKCLALVALSIGVAFLAVTRVSPAKQRVYHHVQAAQAQYCDEGSATFCSHLPLVLIETGGETIEYETEKPVTISIIDNEGGHNHLGDTPKLTTASLIKIRGNSSSRFDKKQYRLNFIKSLDNQERVDREVMGMPAESDWVLNGPFLDKSLVRNYLMYNLAGELMAWAPNVRYCEAFLDGEYQGLYLMIEAVKVGPNRVNVSRPVNGQAGTGYLLARERIHDTNQPLNDFGTYSHKTYNELGIAFPNERIITEANKEYIRQDVSAVEKMLYSLDYDDVKIGYASEMDIQSFVDYFLLNELSLNSDAGALSTYAHRDLRGKLTMGPVWDFNNAFDNYQYYPKAYDEFYLVSTNWYVMLLRDETFVETVIKRYHDLRASTLSEERMFQIIDEAIAFLGPAVDRNFEKWGYSFYSQLLDADEDGVDRDLYSFEEAVAQLKYSITTRGRFLDEHIDVLRQFCAESAVKEWN